MIKRSGFLYIYTSNESPQDVFFDNVILEHITGPVLEETHYYPFGLVMDGISGEAVGKLENRYKYNGIEFDEDLDLNIYEAHFRNLDPQIGRWNQIDPKVENMEMWSPYASNYDNPIRYNDYLGDEPSGPHDPVKKIGLITGREYTLTAPTSFGSSLLFGGQYALGLINEGIEGINRNLNPLVSGAEVLTGKSYESDFTENKSRITSGVETAMIFIPGGKIEMSAAKAIERSIISLDNNALIHAIEKGGRML